MGYLLSPAIGPGRFDICEQCEHQDCAMNRLLIASPCVHCGRAIGERTPFFSVGDPKNSGKERFAHAHCEFSRPEVVHARQRTL